MSTYAKDLRKKCSIICDNGDSFIESSVEIMGIEINFTGKAEITPTLPDGWIMQGNKSKMLLFTLQNLPIKNQKLFTYNGNLKIKSVIVSDVNGKNVICNIKATDPIWLGQYWYMDSEADNWDNFKSKVQKGKVTKTKYNLPDYGLPKVDTTKIKKTRRTTATYSSGSSRGSGGY